MPNIEKDRLKAAVKQVWVRALTVIPPDVLSGLRAARERERAPRGKTYLDILIRNAEMAAASGSVICQDTGVPTFFLKTSLGFPFQGSLRQVFDEALRELTLGEFPMRPMVVHPLTREDRCDNTAVNIPLLHIELEPDLDYLEIKAVPKGAGAGFWGTAAFFPPAAGAAGVKKFVVDSVLRAGSNPCPPVIVGVGIGGPLEETSRLAAVASARSISERNPDAAIAALEEELCEALNMSGIGPMGMGGDSTALAVNIECSGAHKPWLPVAVNINCWPGRRAVCRVYSDGRIEQL